MVCKGCDNLRDYSNWYPSREEKLKLRGKNNFNVHFENGNEGAFVVVNDSFKRKVIIKEHTNPINFGLEDKKMYFIDDVEHPIYRGDEISGIDNNKYLVITPPESNGATSKCRIRKMYDNMTFMINQTVYNYSCILSKGLLYDSGSYINEKTVFSEEDMVALIVQYNEITNKLSLFDPIIINEDEYYKIVKIDPYRLKENNEINGVLQLVLIKSAACMAYDDTLEENTMLTEKLVDYRYGTEPFEISGILRYAKLKERIYNSKAREILTPHSTLQAGDYIEATFLKNPKIDTSTETRMYLTQSLIDKRENYDSAFLIDCNAKFNMKADNGETVTIYAYFENNSTQLMSNERNSNIWNDNSKYKCLVQNNPITRKLGKEVARIIIDGDGYEVVGVDKLSAEGIIGVEFVASMVNPTLDNLELQIADYYRFDNMEDVTSSEEFEKIYADTSLWTYFVGNKALLLGEQGEYQVYYEPKILENIYPDIKPIAIEFRLTYEDGTEVENGKDFIYHSDGEKFFVKSQTKVSLLGTKIKLLATVTFEEKTITLIEGQQEEVKDYKTIFNTKDIYVSGW